MGRKSKKMTCMGRLWDVCEAIGGVCAYLTIEALLLAFAAVWFSGEWATKFGIVALASLAVFALMRVGMWVLAQVVCLRFHSESRRQR